MGNTDSSVLLRGVVQLLLSREDLPSNTYYTTLFTTPFTEEEVWQAIQPDDVREMMVEQPGNLRNVIGLGIDGLLQLSSRKNSALILTRMIPFILEKPEFLSNDLLENLVQNISKAIFAGHDDILRIQTTNNPNHEDSGSNINGNEKAVHLKKVDISRLVWIEPDLNQDVVTFHEHLLRLLMVCFSSSLYGHPKNSPLKFARTKMLNGSELTHSILNMLAAGSSFKSLEKSGLELLLVLLLAEDPESGFETANAQNQFLESLRFVTDASISETPISIRFDNLFRGLFALIDGELEDEVYSLFWKLMEIFPQFRRGELLEPTLKRLWIYQNDPAKSGMLYVCSFILLHLSSERDLCCEWMNKSITNPRDFKQLATLSGCCIADLIVLVLQRANDRLKTCHFTIMCNISPYVRSFSTIAATRLISMYKQSSSPELIELFNNVIQYQYDGNSNLIYGIIREHNLFEDRLEPGALILRVIECLYPKVVDFCMDHPNGDEVLNFIRKTTLVGLLPVPHPIIVRRYQPNPATSKWFSNHVWGAIFLNNCNTNPLWDATAITLFAVST